MTLCIRKEWALGIPARIYEAVDWSCTSGAERTSVVTTAGGKSISGMDVAIGVSRTCTPASSTVDVYILSSVSRARCYVIVAASIRDLLAYMLFSSINNDGSFKVIASIAASAVVSLTDSTRMGWTA